MLDQAGSPGRCRAQARPSSLISSQPLTLLEGYVKVMRLPGFHARRQATAQAVDTCTWAASSSHYGDGDDDRISGNSGSAKIASTGKNPFSKEACADIANVLVEIPPVRNPFPLVWPTIWSCGPAGNGRLPIRKVPFPLNNAILT